MNYFGFWSSFYQLLDPDPDPEGKFNADPSGSGSETLPRRICDLWLVTRK
jgi:hypothetical protein